MKVVMTGGHHSAALPVIEYIRNNKIAIDLNWVGHRHTLKNDTNDTLEYIEITSLGIPFFELKTGKVYKSLDLKNIIKIINSIIESYKYLNTTKPNLIFSFGGYIAAPVVLAGWILGIPIITHEQTTVTGYANKFISFFADKILISWKESEKYFDKSKTVYTGLPLRNNIFEVQYNNYSLNSSLPTLFFIAGKTGSTKINMIIYESMDKLLNFCNIIHQCGDYSVTNDFEKLNKKYASIQNIVKGSYIIKKFILNDEIGAAYSKASLVVSRSGAHTVSEIISLNKPALLIPISWVSHNEQFRNAKLVYESGLGEILEEKDLNSDSLINKVEYMLKNISKYKSQTSQQQKTASLKAAKSIVHEILKYESK